MPRKSNAIEEAVEEFGFTSEIKGEIANEIYGAQDGDTRKAIDKIVSTLTTYYTGVSISGSVIDIDPDQLRANMLWLAVEIAKDLAIVGIRLENFVLPEKLCAVCGSEIGG